MIDTTHMSAKGQVVIPIAIRRKLKLKKDDKFIVTFKGKNIIIKKL